MFVEHPTRRQFLQSIAAHGVAAGLLTSGLRQTSAADPKNLEIIDVHTHFYDPTRPGGVPWPGKDDKVLYRPVLPDEFRKLTEPLGVVGTVVVEASNVLEDNQWLLDLAAKNPPLLGIVGHLTPGAADFPRQLARFAANPLYRGIRISSGLLKAGLNQPLFLNHLRVFAERGLALDVNGGPELLPLVLDLAQTLPEMQVVVDHLSNVRIDGKAPPAEWRKGMEGLAKFPQVACKVSALVESASRDGKPSPSDPAYYAPTIDVAWQSFGADRLLFGSNWPVSARAGDYATLLRIVQAYFQDKEPVAQKKFFGGNARMIYGLKAS